MFLKYLFSQNGNGVKTMEAIKQQATIESTVAGQGVKMSRPRKVLVGVMVLTAIYVVWGIVKVIS